jgi:hypothetical protein
VVDLSTLQRRGVYCRSAMRHDMLVYSPRTAATPGDSAQRQRYTSRKFLGRAPGIHGSFFLPGPARSLA